MATPLSIRLRNFPAYVLTVIGRLSLTSHAAPAPLQTHCADVKYSYIKQLAVSLVLGLVFEKVRCHSDLKTSFS